MSPKRAAECNQNIFLCLKIQKMTKNDRSISPTIMNQAQPDSDMKRPKLTFMPKKLAMRVGGMSISETRVKTFIILFWSRLMIPMTVFWRYSRRSKLKLV